MKNAQTMKMKPFGLLKFNLNKGENPSDFSIPNPTSPASEQISQTSDYASLPDSADERSTFQEENNPFLAYCQAHEQRAKRLGKR